MSELVEARNGMFYNYEAGDAGWGSGINQNFLKLGSIIHMSVINQTTTIPPATPTLGDAYIVAAGATGDWAGEDGNVALWARPIGTGITVPEWYFITPNSGFLAFDQSDSTLYAHNGSNWSTNGFVFTF
jgi:hypothetical protein